MDSVSTKSAPEPSSASAPSKPIRCLVVDTGPIIKNDPSVSTLLTQCEELFTIPSVISEIRDEVTRRRVETTLLPFLTQRNPRPESVKFVSDFAKKTGDLEVLSRPDLHLLALTYELECERNGGDWRLRKTPTQKGLNGAPPSRNVDAAVDSPADVAQAPKEADATTISATGDEATASEPTPSEQPVASELSTEVQQLSLESTEPEAENAAADTTEVEEPTAEIIEEIEEGSDDDSDGWITPSNLKKHQEKDRAGGAPSEPIQKVLQVALLTSDFAMQNVSLRINLNLLNPTLYRITQVKTWVLRCYGCFKVTRNMEKQFCPGCGQATLTRTSCSTDSAGNFKLHLKRNYQYNKRGNVYSVPKPVHGSANGKNANVIGGGKNGWGTNLILAEDQKEYVRRQEEDKRTKSRDLFDEDYLPSILTGDRRGGNQKMRIGAGRGVNSKRHR